MTRKLFFIQTGIVCLSFFYVQLLTGQNVSPYWSTAGNTNATTSSKLGTVNAVPLRIMTKNTDRIRVDTLGRVGIGTITPAQLLHVAGNGTLTGNFGIGTTAPAQKLHVVGNTIITGNLGIGATPIQKLHVAGNGVFTGFVGIGTTSPSYKLHIVTSGVGVYANSTGGNYGVWGNSTYLGVYGSGTSYGVYGSGNYGVYGYSPGNYGVYGTSGYTGVYGSGNSYGVYGTSASNYGVYGTSTNGVGVYGYSTNLKGGYFYSVNEYGLWARTGRTDRNWAGVFEGNVYTFNAYQTSDKNLKENIEDFGDATSIINKLKPKIYEFRHDGKLANMNLPKGRHYGVLAQDLEEMLPNLVMEVENEISAPTKPEPTAEAVSSPDGKASVATTPQIKATEKMTVKAVNYTELIPIIVKGMQELYADKDKKINDLQQQINELKAMVETLSKHQGNTTTFSTAFLKQNIPNPVNNNTVIGYYLPGNTARAQIRITDAMGKALKVYSISKGEGQININSGELPAGAYSYTLYVNDKKIDTKQMVITK